jgi:hypothetical protein
MLTFTYFLVGTNITTYDTVTKAWTSLVPTSGSIIYFIEMAPTQPLIISNTLLTFPSLHNEMTRTNTGQQNDLRMCHAVVTQILMSAAPNRRQHHQTGSFQPSPSLEGAVLHFSGSKCVLFTSSLFLHFSSLFFTFLPYFFTFSLRYRHIHYVLYH